MQIQVPDYYKDFTCKCGECRTCCCDGWGITVTEEEYFRLLGMDCSRDLRHRLDCAFSVIAGGDNQRYAKIERNYIGKCPLQREDGLCALQKECGEEAIPRICRLYPRSILFCAMEEGACANSCEKVIELLIHRRDSLGHCSINSPYATDIPVPEEEKKQQQQTFAVLQDRSLSLEKRLIHLGEVLGVSADPVPAVDSSVLFAHLLEMVKALERFSATFGEYSIIAREDMAALQDNCSMDKVEQRYREARRTFDTRFPDGEIWFENILNNHLFFERFPYDAEGKSVEKKYAELCGIFATLIFVCVAYTENHPKEEDFVDCAAALFRCFEHTNAEDLILEKLRQTGFLSYGYLKQLISAL